VQLTNRKGKVDMNTKPFGRLWLESKEDMARRNVSSPNRADAVLGCMAPLRSRGVVATRGETPTQSTNPWADDYAPESAEKAIPEEILRGMDAG
jgi:hypothetical protein